MRKILIKLLYPSRSAFSALILVAAVYLATLCLLPQRGFWITDNANKFLQMQAIINSNYTDYSIPWPGQTVDPDFTCNPLPHPFSQVHDHKLYSVFSPVFAVVSSFPYRLFGVWGLYILPLSSSLFCLAGLAHLSRIMGLNTLTRNIAVIIAGLSTPLWFYSVVFWEHSLAVCLALWGALFYLNFLKKNLNRYLILGCVFSALSVYFRDELYLFCLVLVAMALLYVPGKRLKTFALAVSVLIACLVPLWLFQALSIGHPFGFHLGSHLTGAAGIAEHFSARPNVIYNLFLAAHPRTWISLAITAPFLVAFILNPRLGPRLFKLTFPLYCLFALICYLLIFWGYYNSPSSITWIFHTNSLFAAAPILILALFRLKKPDSAPVDGPLLKEIWLICLAYALVYSLAAPQLGSTGIHWGNRFLLILYPLLALPAAHNLSRWSQDRSLKFHRRISVVGVILVLAFALQVHSIRLLYQKKDFSRLLNLQITKLPEQIVITDAWWAPQALYSQFYDKEMFYTPDQQRLSQLLIKLRLGGYQNLLFVTQRKDLPENSFVAQVPDPHLNFFSLKFYSLDISSLAPDNDVRKPPP